MAPPYVVSDMKKLLLILVVVACGSPNPIPELPPPMSVGKCFANKFDASQAVALTCVYLGYTWSCRYSFFDKSYACEVGLPATGERPATEPGVTK